MTNKLASWLTMKKNKSANTAPDILHIFNDPKFSHGYFEFLLKHNIDLSSHYLFHYRCKKSTCSHHGMAHTFSPSFFSIIPNILLSIYLFRSKKIIIHSLASPALLAYLYCFPSLTRKCYWAIWGKDLYYFKSLKKVRFYHKIYEHFRIKVFKAIPYIIGFSKRDYELAKKWYGSTAIRYENFMYPSNCYKELPLNTEKSDKKLIIVGNSAEPTNNHHDAFRILEKHKDENIQIIAPLSYGNKAYANEVIDLGNSIFGEKFVPLQDLLPLDEYIALIGRVDIGIFAHDRQQAMGNIITLLGMGKAVFIRDDITTWGTLTEMGIKIYNLEQFNLINYSQHQHDTNRKIIKEYFSEENLLSQWEIIFNL